jgi:hypothetical protein
MSENTNRSEINRQNAQHSTGPRTPEGKAIVSQNRLSHGLTGARIVLPGESEDEYNALREQLAIEHEPVGATEAFLVDQLAQHQWRLIRMSVMEQEMFCVAARLDSGNESIPAVAACNMMRNAPTIEQAFARLNRYENSIRRAYHQALTQLRVTQAERKRLQQQPEPTQPAEKKKYDSNPPAPDPVPQVHSPLNGTPSGHTPAEPPNNDGLQDREG